MKIISYLILLGLVLVPITSQAAQPSSFTIKLVGSDTIVIFGDYAACNFLPESRSDSNAAFRQVSSYADEHGFDDIEASITKDDEIINVVLGHGGDSSSNTFVGEADDGCELKWGLSGS